MAPRWPGGKGQTVDCVTLDTVRYDDGTGASPTRPRRRVILHIGWTGISPIDDDDDDDINDRRDACERSR
jgi:hypothetical protein